MAAAARVQRELEVVSRIAACVVFSKTPYEILLSFSKLIMLRVSLLVFFNFVAASGKTDY